MRYALTRIITASQEGYIKHHGDVVWEWLSNEESLRNGFSVASVAACPAIRHLGERTRLDVARCVIANVQAQHDETSELAPFERRGNWYFWR